MLKDRKQRVRTMIEMDRELKRQVKVRAAIEGKGLWEWISEAISDKLDSDIELSAEEAYGLPTHHKEK